MHANHIIHSLLGISVLALMPACAPDDPATGNDTTAQTSTTGDEETGDSSSSETTGGECGLLGDPCGDAGCCDGLMCDPDTNDCQQEGDSSNTTQFVGVVDGLPGVPGQCDVWNPDDCPEGEKCTAYAIAGSSWDANKCVQIMGNGQPGDDCVATDGSGVSGNDDCDRGSMCWDIDQDTMTGYCVAFCTGSANNPMCTGDSLCAIYNNGVLPLCLPTCDPLSGGADCPNTGNLCINDPGGNGFVCVLDASAGMGTYGTECQYANSCNQGLYCADAAAVPNCQGAQGCCSEFCDVNEANTCSGMGGGQECVPWWEVGMAPPGYEHVGGCAIPG